MILENYTMEITRASCRPEAQTVHCIARFEQDISEVIPYLNAELGGFLLEELKQYCTISNFLHNGSWASPSNTFVQKNN